MKKTDLSNCMLLVPSRSAPPRKVSELTIEPATMSGAIMTAESGVTDVALARNLLLGRALETIALLAIQGRQPEVCIWIDDDTIVGPQTLASMATVATELDVAVSAQYIMRSCPSLLSATPLEDCETRPHRFGTLVPVYSGLGCLAIPTHQLARLAAASPILTMRPTPTSEPRRFPAVVACGPVRTREGEWSWCSEDYWLCERLWSECSGVYLGTWEAGHLIHGEDSHPVYPKPESLLGDRPFRSYL